jgi:hypothetical protein
MTLVQLLVMVCIGEAVALLFVLHTTSRALRQGSILLRRASQQVKESTASINALKDARPCSFPQCYIPCKGCDHASDAGD